LGQESYYRKRINEFINLWYESRSLYFESEWSDSRFDAYIGINNTGNKILDYVLNTVNDNHKEKQRNEKYSRFNTMGRLRNYNIYKFETCDGKFIEESKEINMRGKSLGSLIKSARIQGYEAVDLPLPVNEYSRPVGVIRDNMNTSNFSNNKNKHYEKDFVVSDYLRACRSEIFDKLMDSGTQIYSGEWKYAQGNIVNMCLNPRPQSFAINTLIDGYFSRAGIDLILPKLTNYSTSYIFGLPINPKAKSGHLTQRLLFLKRKLSTIWTKEAAVYYANKIMRTFTPTLDKSLTSIGGREKAININLNVNKKYKTRGINNPEDIPTLISQSVIKPINEELQKINKGFNYGGRVNGMRNFMTYEDDLRCDLDMVNINPDVSEHDGSVKEENAIVAMAFLRCCYPESRALDNLFIYIFSSIIFRRLVLPESGLVYEVTKGLSTGHGFTSLMTTLIAYGSIATSINLTHKPEEVQRTVIRNAGDDITAKVMTHHLTDMYNILLEQSGFLFDDIREYSGYFSALNPILQCTFLKKKYGEYMLSWNDLELFKNLMHPTMKSKSYGSLLENLKQMIYQAPFDTHLNNSIKTIFIMQILRKYSITGRNKDIKYIQDNMYNYHLLLNKLYSIGGISVDPLVLINNLKFKRVLYYNSSVDSYLYLDIKPLLISYLNIIDTNIITKKIWFTKDVYFEQHKVTMRLAIFDIGKLNTKPKGYYYTYYRNAQWE
jgi:hypothetical protein